MKKFCLVIVSTVFSVIFMVSPTYAQESETELFGPRVEQEYVQDYVQIQPRFSWLGTVWRTTHTLQAYAIGTPQALPMIGIPRGVYLMVVVDVNRYGFVQVQGGGAPFGQIGWWIRINDLGSHQHQPGF